MAVAGMLFSLAYISFSLSRLTWLSVAFLFVAGWSLVSFLANANSIVQLSVEDHLRGRVMSVFSLFFLGMAPVGSLIIGTVAEHAGTPATLTVAGLLCLLAGIRFTKRVISSF
jgi:predicted MFS family arabinose efflux permease